MLIKARINGEGGQMFLLGEWSAPAFAANPTLLIQSSDLTLVKNTFSHITSIEIYVSDNPVATYTEYDTFGAISYEGSVFVQHENIFAECMRVSLRRASLVEEVERIRDKVDPVIDPKKMTIDEYRTYLLKQISATCRQQIYAGASIPLPSGATEHFTYDAEDQQNLTSAMAILMIAPELPAIPYHSSNGGLCRMIPSADLVTIYLTLEVQLTYLVTRCNYMNAWIRSINSKEELMEITWETDLPQEYQTSVNEIYSQTLMIMQTIKDKFIPNEKEE